MNVHNSLLSFELMKNEYYSIKWVSAQKNEQKHS